MKERKAIRKEKRETLWKEFKKFISKGNVVDMAIGVIMGSAFGAIVTSVTNILLSICTWGVPGGINGLVTILYPANDLQKGLNGVGQSFKDLSEATINYAATQGVTVEAGSVEFFNYQSELKGLYTLHGSTWIYNRAAFIDWGAMINAVISFLIIAITLFFIMKVYSWSKKKRADFEAKLQEEYYLKHPEERPVPPTPGKPAPTEVELLTQINEQLKVMSANKVTEKK